MSVISSGYWVSHFPEQGYGSRTPFPCSQRSKLDGLYSQSGNLDRTHLRSLRAHKGMSFSRTIKAVCHVDPRNPWASVTVTEMVVLDGRSRVCSHKVCLIPIVDYRSIPKSELLAFTKLLVFHSNVGCHNRLHRLTAPTNVSTTGASRLEPYPNLSG